METPVPQPYLFIVGADKGGVGKTTISRALLDYFRQNGIDFKAFDTEHPNGGLQRFFPDRAQIVDLSKSNDQMKVFDNLASTQASVIDIRAGLLSPTIKVLTDIGMFEMAKANKLRVVVMHILGPATQSLDEVKSVVGSIAEAKYVPVANHIDDTDYTAPTGAINVPKLDGEAMKAIDAAAKPFHDFINSQGSFVLRGYTRKWLVDVFAQFDSHQLNVLS